MFQMMKVEGLTPNDVTYNSMIDVCVRSNKMSEAWQLFAEMKSNSVIPDNFTYSTLIKGLKANDSS